MLGVIFLTSTFMFFKNIVTDSQYFDMGIICLERLTLLVKLLNIFTTFYVFLTQKTDETSIQFLDDEK